MGSQMATFFNVKKCKSMHIGKSEPREYYIKDNEGNIHKNEQVNQEKDLYLIKYKF